MSDRLGGAFRALAESAAPSTRDPVVAGHDAWRAAASHRRRRRLVGLAGAAVVLLVGVLVAGSIHPAAGPVPPAGQPLPPGEGIPSQLFTVKPWLPTIGSDPIPPIAYIIQQQELDGPAAVSVDGSYRYLPPAPDVEGYELTSYAVSPDGRRLALAWGIPRGGSGRSLQAHATVIVYEVTTGERLGPWLGQGFGSVITGLAWKPDGDGLAWDEFRPDLDADPDGSFGSSVAVMFDWSNGDRRDLTGYVGPLAWSPDGTRLVAVSVADGPSVVPLAGGQPVLVDLPDGGVAGPVAWSPDGGSFAVISPCSSGAMFVGGTSCQLDAASRLSVVDAATGAVEQAPVTGFTGDAMVLGWRAGRPVLGGGQVDNPHSLSEWEAPYAVLGGPGAGGAGGALVTTSPSELRAILTAQAAQGTLATGQIVAVHAPRQPVYGWAALRWKLGAVGAAVALGGVVIGLAVLVGVVLRVRRRRTQVPAT